MPSLQRSALRSIVPSFDDGPRTEEVRVRIPDDEFPYYALFARICGIFQFPEKNRLSTDDGDLRNRCRALGKRLDDPLIEFANVRTFFLFQILLAGFNPQKSEAFRRLGHGAGNDENSYVLSVRVSVAEKKALDLAANKEPMVLVLGTARWFSCELWQFIQEWEWTDGLNPELEFYGEHLLWHSSESRHLRRKLFERVVPLCDAQEKRIAQLRRHRPGQEEWNWFAKRRNILVLRHTGIAEDDPNAVSRLFS